MQRTPGPVTTIFNQLVNEGHITPVQHMEDLRLPGEFESILSFITYSTPEIPIRSGAGDAKLEQRPQGNFAASGDVLGIRIR